MVKPLLPPKPKRKFRKYRPLTPREKRQRAIIKRFLKTFIPLAIIAYLLQNLPRLVDSGAKWLEDNILAHLGMRGEVVMYRFPESCNAFEEKTFLVTGANSGLGFETAKYLSVGGAKSVIMGCRDEAKCEEARLLIDIARKSTCGEEGESNVVFFEGAPLDLDDVNSIENFTLMTDRFLRKKTGGLLDVLINNAGIMGSETLMYNKYTKAEKQLHTNHVAHYILTAKLLPFLKLAKGRIVNVSSMMGLAPGLYSNTDFNFENRFHHSIVAYGAAKRANLLFTHELHVRLYDKYGVSSVAAHPGYSRTSLMTNNWQFAPRYLRLFVSTNRILSMSSEEGAKSQIRAALDFENVQSDDFVGPLFALFGPPVNIGRTIRNVFNFFWLSGFRDVDSQRLMDFSEYVSGGLKIE